MKYILLATLSLSLSGCGFTCTTTTEHHPAYTVHQPMSLTDPKRAGYETTTRVPEYDTSKSVCEAGLEAPKK